MSKDNYVLKLIGYSVVIAVPLVALAAASKARADKTRPTGPPPTTPRSFLDIDVPAAVKDFFTSGGLSLPDEPQPDFAGWYSYKMRWIRVDEYPGDREVDIDNNIFIPAGGPLVNGVTYHGRFRWTIMLSDASGAQPLATEVVFETGSAYATLLGLGDKTELEAAARNDALARVADRAARWIDLATGTA